MHHTSVNFPATSGASYRGAPTATLYGIGQRISTPDFTIDIKGADDISQIIRAVFPAPMHACVYVADDLDIASEHVTKSIDSIVRRIARRFAPGILLPQARQVADALGVRPASWEISRGQRTLGTCSSAGRIRLSALLVFYPADLRRYVICHELAHLTHMNHGPAFHALCDRYYGGASANARKAMRTVKTPLIK